MNDLLPNWGYAVWINIICSITVAICGGVIVGVARKRRRALGLDLDAQRAWIKVWILSLIAFFVGRGVQVGLAGMTIADPWFLAIGAWLSVSSIILTVNIIRNPSGYEMLHAWDPSMPDRRKNPPMIGLTDMETTNG